MKKLLLSFFFLFLLPLFAQAFSAQVIVDTGIETINALEGTLEIPSGILVSDIYTGNSAILFWIVTPVLDTEKNAISFAGFTPGGFRGKYPIFSIMGDFSQSELSQFGFSNINALKNDGSGTVVAVKFKLILSETARDTLPPESFDLIISSSPNIFEGKHFLSFATQDKGTGIKLYEYASTWLLMPGKNNWLETKSPMVLSRKMLFQKIYVRAIDRADNYRETSIAGPYRYLSLSIGTIILLCMLVYLKRLAFWHHSYFS